MSLSPSRICAYLSRCCGKILKRFPNLITTFAAGPEWLIFNVTRGPVPPEAYRALLPGVRPGLAAPTDEERRLLTCLNGGPQTGVEWAALLDMAADGGAFQRRVADLQARGFVFNPGKGYRLTEYGAWALAKD